MPVPAPSQALGDTGAYTFQEFALDGDEGAQAIKVNVGSGNLFIRSKMGELRGPGVPAVAYRVYNSQNDIPGGQLGPWREDYDITGLVISSASDSATFFDGTGARWDFTNEDGAWVSPAGVNATLSQAADGTWLISYNRTGERVKFNTSGWVIGRVDRNGVGISYGYDGPRVVSIRDAVGKSLRMAYYPEDSLESVESAGRAVTFHRDTDGRLVSSDESGMGRPVWDMSYGASDLLATLSDGDRTIAFEYDGANRVTSATLSRADEPSLVTSFAYTETGTVVTDPKGGQTVYEIDTQWRVTETTDQLGRSRSQTWTANSDVETAADGFSTGGEGNVTSSTYDELNNLTGVTLPSGAATQSLYGQGPGCEDAQGGNPYRVKCTIDASGNTQSMQYDAAGNLTTQTDASEDGTASSTSYTYEGADGTLCGGVPGQMCSATDGNGGTTAYEYVRGNLTKVRPPEPLGPTSYEYDAVGRVTKVTDGNAAVTSYSYDKADRVTLTTFNNGETLTSVWQPNGLLLSETDSGKGGAFNYTYNLLGKQTLKNYVAPAMNVPMRSIYDDNGNLIEARGSSDVKYQYDAANQVVAVHSRIETCTIGAVPASGSECVQFGYDQNGNEISRVFPAGARQDTSRDESGRAIRITAKDKAGATVYDVGFGYSEDGQDRALLQTRTSFLEQGIPTGAVTTYSYDSQNRLTGAVERNGQVVNAQWTYGYDAAGNRTIQTREGNTSVAAGTITYDYNAANQLTATSADTTTWTYDAAGNQTRNGITGEASTYGDRLQVLSNGTTEYSTFGPGNQQQMTEGALVSHWHTGLGLVRTSQSGTNDGTTMHPGSTTYWVRTPDGAPVYSVERTGNRYANYFVTDNVGSVTGLFAKTGQWSRGFTFSPFGERRVQRATSGDFKIAFAGGYEEKPNRYKLGARYYDASLGRFTQFDPSGQETHPYVYADANPTNLIDPTGLDSCTLAAGVAGIAHGGIWSTALGGPAGLAASIVVGGFWLGVSELGCD